MDDLIKKNALSEEIESLTVHVTGLRAGKGVLSKFMDEYRKSVLRIVREQPITTEADIRAKAIEEFAEKLKREFEDNIFSDEEKFKYDRKTQEAICAQNATWKVAIQYVEKLAEQLKGE